MYDYLRKKMELTSVQRELLYQLTQNSRQHVSKLAKIPYLTKDIISYQMKLFAEKQIIRNYITRINQSVFSVGIALFLLKIEKRDTQKIQDAIVYLQKKDYINWIATTLGSADIVLTAHYNSNEHLQTIQEDLAQNIQGMHHEMHLYTQELKFDRGGLILAGKTQSSAQPPFSNKRIELDNTDTQLLLELNYNARIRNNKLAEKLSISEDTVRERIKRLEKQNIILGYTIFVDTTKLGYEGYMVYFNSAVAKLQVQALCETIGEIEFCAQMTGRFNYVCSIQTKTRTTFNSILSRLCVELQVTNYDMLLLLDSHKEIFVPHLARSDEI